jgi:sulfide:quinone oxidoreductase
MGADVVADGGAYEADFLIVAVGADYDMDATPGLAEANEFYTVAGAQRFRDVQPSFTRGKALIGCAERRTNARRRQRMLLDSG